MSWHSIFVAEGRPRLVKGQTYAASQTPTAVGVFITPQSIASFPVASVVVTIVWSLLQRIFGAGLKQDWVVLVIAGVVGCIVFVSNISDAAVRPKNRVGWFLAIGTGILNSLLLAASALGILKA